MFDNSMLSKLRMQQPIISFWIVCSLWYRLFWNPCFSCNLQYFCLWWRLAVLLWAPISTRRLDYAICKTKIFWRGIDTHVHEGVTYMSCTVSVEKPAITSYMNYCNNATFTFARMQDQQSLTLHWCSSSGWGRECVAFVFAPTGGQYLIYRCFQPIASEISQDARAKIIDVPLMLIFRMGQGSCRYCFCP